ncbi:DC1 [Arabidopsis thaliana x Arabidopsis arenosa]|uniref:DC1 n=1 Tax=Arabidopsis thaliana x Arabidopsis arenosa TaxID=1240361 RepID=A0A8T1XJU6_9BRAS|nr:DC1 [Arabidopsis thaliana x Arabidopsis arenosa]
MATTAVNLPIHEHPLFPSARCMKGECDGCHVDGFMYSGYFCNEPYCNVWFDKECAEAPAEINYSSHPHPLLLTNVSRDGPCDLCGQKLLPPFYSCSTCEFKVDLICGMKPSPPAIEHPLCHDHPVVFLKIREEKVPCELCKESIEGPSYSCLECDVYFHVDCVHLSKECDFVTGRACIDIPRVININRHDHRIHFTHHLGAGYSKCGVCHKSVNQYKGAYSCSACPNYAVHTTCAVRRDVWDGVELEGIPEIIEDISPFKEVGDNLICHFTHEEHPLKLHKDGINHDERIRCAACVHPVGFDSIYCCEECPFILHEKCAKLPMKKRLVFGTRPYTLMTETTTLDCKRCGILSDGFMYSSRNWFDVDVHCGSLNEPLVHDGHEHPLYFAKKGNHFCDGCQKRIGDYMLRCEDCDFNLCLYCATLPEKIWHRNDGHPLTLCCGDKEKASGKYWCDICERELDPSIWFYTCSDCGVTLHAQCVLGDFSRFKPGQIYRFGEKEIEVQAVLNNHNTRPFCIQCQSRCKVPFILKILKVSDDDSEDDSDHDSDDVSDQDSDDVSNDDHCDDDSDDISDHDSDDVSDQDFDDVSNHDSDDDSDDDHCDDDSDDDCNEDNGPLNFKAMILKLGGKP